MDENELKPNDRGDVFNEDPAEVIELEPEEGGDSVAEFEYDEDAYNLVPEFMKHDQGKKALQAISGQVKRNKEDGWDGSAAYRERFARDWRLFTGDLPPKEPPHEHSANIHVPLLLKNIVRIFPQTWSELFGDWSEPLEFEPLGEDPMSQQIAKIRTKHTNYQFQEGIPDFQRQVARGLMLFWIAGDVIAESYYDDLLESNRHEVLTVDEVIVPFVYVSTMPDFSDCPWIIRLKRMYRHELQAKRKEWHDVQKVLDREPPAWYGDGEAKFRETMAEVQGQEPEDDGKGEYVILQWDGWVPDLPGQDRDRWCRVHLDETTGAVLCLQIREEPTAEEEDRYAQQVRELDEYRAALERFEQRSQQHQQISAQVEAARGFLPPDMMAIADRRLAQVAPQMPVAPRWLPEPDEEEEAAEGEFDYLEWLQGVEPEPPRKSPIHMYSHAVNLEPIVGNLGLGHGRMLGDYNRAANISAQQFSDQATAANIPRLVIDPDAEPERPALVFEPGGYVRLKPPPGKTVNDAFAQLRVDPANQQLLELLKLMDDAASDTATSPEVLGGAPGKSNETFRGYATRLEQAKSILGVPTQSFAGWFKQIGRHNARLNAMFLPEESVVRVRDPMLQRRERLTVRREIYEGPQDITVKADLRFISRAERVKEADELLQFPLHIPPLAQNAAFLYTALMNSLRVRKAFDLMRTLGPPPPQSPLPFGINPMMPPMGQPQAAPGAQPRSPQQRPAGPRRPMQRPPQPQRQLRRPQAPAQQPPPQQVRTG